MFQGVNTLVTWQLYSIGTGLKRKISAKQTRVLSLSQEILSRSFALSCNHGSLKVYQISWDIMSGVLKLWCMTSKFFSASSLCLWGTVHSSFAYVPSVWCMYRGVCLCVCVCARAHSCVPLGHLLWCLVIKLAFPWWEFHTIQKASTLCLRFVQLVKLKADLTGNNQYTFTYLLILLDFYILVKILVLFFNFGNEY